MKRHFIAGGVDRHGIARPLQGCSGYCQQGRSECDCELANAVRPSLHVVRSVPSRPPIQVTGGKVPFSRRFKRFRAALWAFLTSGCFEL